MKRGAGFSPSSPASVKVLQSESGDWRSSDWTFLKPTHILVFGQLAFCLLLPHPSLLSSCTSYFLRRDFVLSMWGKGDCLLRVYLALALSLPGILLAWESLDSCFSLCTFVFLELPPSPLLFNNRIQHRLLTHVLGQHSKCTHTALYILSSCHLSLSVCLSIYLYIHTHTVDFIKIIYSAILVSWMTIFPLLPLPPPPPSMQLLLLWLVLHYSFPGISVWFW